MKTNFFTLHGAYYSTPAPKTRRELARNVSEFRSRLFHWPARERGIAPGWGNRATRRAYAIEGTGLFYGSSHLAINARRLFIPD